MASKTEMAIACHGNGGSGDGLFRSSEDGCGSCSGGVDSLMIEPVYGSEGAVSDILIYLIEIPLRNIMGE